MPINVHTYLRRLRVKHLGTGLPEKTRTDLVLFSNENDAKFQIHLENNTKMDTGYYYVLTHRARTPRKWTQMDKATFGLRIITFSQNKTHFP